MPEILKDPHAFTTRGRNSSIDWAGYFTTYAGQVVKFVAGSDYSIKSRSFAVAAQEYAKAQALGKVQTSVTDDAVILKFPSAAETKAAQSQARDLAEIAGQETIQV